MTNKQNHHFRSMFHRGRFIFAKILQKQDCGIPVLEFVVYEPLGGHVPVLRIGHHDVLGSLVEVGRHRPSDN